ncbi:MAG: hypothetical protein N3B13_05030 [Deltaproteobacteria bacterium]|nr:hypothetical protein [Deltaproteobacteria bacterium]
MKEIQIEINKDAADIGLADLIASLIRDNCSNSLLKKRIFANLKGDVLITAKDADVSILLSFDKGRMSISDGKGKNSGLAIKADSENIIGLSNIRLLLGYPFLLNREGVETIIRLITGDIEIKGIGKNIIFGINLLRIISVN